MSIGYAENLDREQSRQKSFRRMEIFEAAIRGKVRVAQGTPEVPWELLTEEDALDPIGYWCTDPSQLPTTRNAWAELNEAEITRLADLCAFSEPDGLDEEELGEDYIGTLEALAYFSGNPKYKRM